MIAALAFVPENDVRRVFHDLSNNIDASMDVIMDYIEETFIGMVRRGQRRRLRYAYSMWGVYDRVQDNLPQTNYNSVDSTLWLHKSYQCKILKNMSIIS